MPVDPVDNGWCFLSWTRIHTLAGYKNIEDVQVGDMVLGYNEITKRNEYNKVSQIFVHGNNYTDLYELSINWWDILKVTSVHPFYVVRNWFEGYQWIEAQNLKIWDMILLKNGRYEPVDKITHYPYIWDVYNLEVENTHNYYVGKW